MAFDWAEYQTLAERLRQEDNEAARRSAISRIYYSVFCRARNYLKNTGFPITTMGPSSHQIVWNEFKKRGGTFRGIGVNGHRLHENRKDADYEDEITNLISKVDDSFRCANNLLTYLAQVQRSEIG